MEEIARERRYIFLNKVREKHNWKYIITAHHLDDKIETFLFNLVRWSKLSWLINMKENTWNILRPLIKIKKSEIIKYLDENNLEYKIDKTNFDLEITRNYLRYEIIPKLWKINKNFKENISNTLDYFDSLTDFIDIEVKNFLGNYDYMDNKNFFVLEDFKELDIFLKKEIIRYIFFISNWNSTIWLSEANIDEILKFINWKNNKTIKEIKWLKMKKDNNLIFY
jgi:tRNA(Ile)-lysidine synthase